MIVHNSVVVVSYGCVLRTLRLLVQISKALNCLSSADLFKLLTIDPVADSGGSAMSDTKLSFCVMDEREVTGEALADVTGVTAELPLVLALAIAFFVASLTSWNFSINLPSSASLAKPKPKIIM